MAQTKCFDARLVGTVTSGIGLGYGSFSDVQEVFDHVLGWSVFTHELADRNLGRMVRDLILEQHPGMPTSLEDTSQAQEVGEELLAQYPQGVALEKGNGHRSEHPLDSLQRISGGDKTIIVVET